MSHEEKKGVSIAFRPRSLSGPYSSLMHLQLYWDAGLNSLSAKVPFGTRADAATFPKVFGTGLNSLSAKVPFGTIFEGLNPATRIASSQ